MAELEKNFDAKTREPELYKTWESSGFFNPDNLKGKPFTIIMPPPNANGSLHIGHALFVTTQDIMIRYKRMAGFKALWLPGADHAGFETQVVYAKKIEKEGRKFWEIPREQLYGEIKDFTLTNKAHMEGQLRALGASVDWSREKFTLDADIKEVVYETFKKLYDDGLIYRGSRIINWCARHQTSLSDLEIVQPEVTDQFYHLQYGPFTIATARPETKFGDKYVVVHPDDKRYSQYSHGQQFDVEWINGPIKATLIKDASIDMSFGTGAMTITPWHDANDFDIAQRHNLPKEQIIDWQGKLLPIAGEFFGQHISKARALIVEKLKVKGLLVKTEENYKHAVPACYKCNTPIEPQIRPQWFVAMTKKPKGWFKKSLRDLAVNAVKKGEISFVTERFKNDFLRWMENLRDWNISRQIVWGIRIPVWYCQPEKKMGFAGDIVSQVFDAKTRTYRLKDRGYKMGDMVAFEDTATGKLFGQGKITEVIQTTVGALDLQDKKHWKTYTKREELIAAFKRHYPEKEVTNDTPVWVYTYIFEREATHCSEVVISGQKPEKCPACGGASFIQETDVFDTWFSSGQWPFATLMTTSSMSHYPTDVMETGWDILFFWVARMVMLGKYRTGKAPFKTVYLHGLVRDKERQKMSKSKGNVIDPLGVAEHYGMDAVRMALIAGNAAGTDPVISEDKIKGYRNFTTKIWNMAKFIGEFADKSVEAGEMDAAVLKELAAVKKEVTSHLDGYKLHLAAESIYHYVWHTVADKVIEANKAKKVSIKTLEQIFSECLKMLHPFMPFVTEEIWSKLNKKNLLLVEKW